MAPRSITPEDSDSIDVGSARTATSERRAVDERLGARKRPDFVMNTSTQGSSDRLERRREAEDDRALVEKAQSGDKRAFRALVERHQAGAFSVAVRLLRDEQEAREVVQEAFVRAYRKLDQFEGSSAFFTWLYRIVTNIAIDHRRRPGRRIHESLEASLDDEERPIQLVAPPEHDPGEAVRRQEIGARIQEALDALPPYHRAVILMREVDGLSYQEMAEAMNVSKGTIMSRLFHARQKLQRALVDCYREHLGTEPNPNQDDSSTAE